MPGKHLISVVLGTYSRLAFLKLAIDSSSRELDRRPFSHEFIVVEGGSRAQVTHEPYKEGAVT